MTYLRLCGSVLCVFLSSSAIVLGCTGGPGATSDDPDASSSSSSSSASSSGTGSSSSSGSTSSSSGTTTSSSSGTTTSSSGSTPCNANENRCGGQCVPNSPQACGASCTVCPTIGNGTAVCNGGSCGKTCNANYNLCNGGTVCTANTPLSCGATCAACPTTTNGTATCSAAGVCGTTCAMGYVACASGCCPQKAIMLSVGSSHSCAITEAGGAKCWGSNQSGVDGNGNTVIIQKIPVDVVGLSSGVTYISASQQTTCAIAAGVPKCWGYNGWLQVPNVALFSYSSTPQDQTFGAAASFIVTGTSATCALTGAGGLKCWGQQLGTSGNSATPVDVTGFGTSGVAETVIGYGHGCFRTTAGGAKCWGKGDAGELGNSNQFNSTTPVDVTGLTTGVLALSTSFRYTCAIVTGGVVKCWGESDKGQLGPNVAIGAVSSFPVTVTLPSAATSISAGEPKACAVVSGGAVYCWGGGSQTPTAFAALPSGVATIGVGSDASCALMTTGSVKCWGANGVGQLGDSSTNPSATPVSVVAFP